MKKSPLFVVYSTHGYRVYPDPRLYLAVKSSGYSMEFPSDTYPVFTDLVNANPERIYIVSTYDDYLTSGQIQQNE